MKNQNMIDWSKGILFGKKNQKSIATYDSIFDPWSIILSEKSQLQKTTYCMILFTLNV
jgi:hypothetical protein